MDENLLTIIDKEVITIRDLMDALGVGYSTAAALIRSIKEYSDCLRLAGRVHRADYIKFLMRKQEPRKAEPRKAKNRRNYGTNH